jgi:helix-turn-helix protein
MKWLTVHETSRKLRRSPILVYRWLTTGRLKGQKFGHAWLVSEREIARFLKNEPERRRRGGSGDEPTRKR